MKTCSKCSIKKSKGKFYKDGRLKDGVKSYCKTCSDKYHKHYVGTPRGKEAQKKYWTTPKGKESRRNCKLKGTYGITIEEYDNIFKDQGEGCAICGISKPGGGKGRFRVDHDHITGKIRGLLCDKCNIGLGCFNDKTEILTKAIQYLS